MKRKVFITAFCISALLLFGTITKAQSDKTYSDGPVWIIQFIQTKSGMRDAYLKDLSANWVKLEKAAKEQGIIMDYKIFSTQAAAKTDWDLMLMTEVKNYAALDGMDDKMTALGRKILGSADAEHQSATLRNNMRDRLGGRLAQELIFK